VAGTNVTKVAILFFYSSKGKWSGGLRLNLKRWISC